MSMRIAAVAVRTCFGDGPATFAALMDGRHGAAPLRRYAAAQAGVTHGYEIPGGPGLWRATRWLGDCVAEAVAAAGMRPMPRRTVTLVGTGLRELAAVEARAVTGVTFPAERLHFGAVTSTAIGVAPAVTLAGACSAGGHVLALAQDLLELGDADCVVAAGTDAMTASMLAMIGRVAAEPATRVLPFDRERPGVLLGEGAVALVLLPGHEDRRPASAATGPAGHDHPRRAGAEPCLGRLLATGLSCDAVHETAPDRDGILRAMRDAYGRAERTPADTGLVFAHGTGTQLNDPVEARALIELFGAHRPYVTAIKGAVGHTSGGSALLSLAMALYVMREGAIPPITGLTHPLPEAEQLRLVRDAPVRARPGLVQIDSFGFGGVNAVSLVEAV